MRFFDDSEERIERMLESGRGIMREAIETYKPVAIFAGFSGGNDSIVATHLHALSSVRRLSTATQ